MAWIRATLVALLCVGLAASVPADDPPTRQQKASPKASDRAKSKSRAGTNAHADAIPKFRYRGMAIDVSVLWGSEALEQVLPTLRRQIDITVDARVKPEIAEYFRSIPAKLGPVPIGGPGYCAGQSVTMIPQPIAFDRVVLLHELCHAFHQKVTDAQRREILKYYKEALQAYRMSPNEYFLTNPQEFFAATASIYLHGQIPRAPYTRKAIHAAQPEYHKLLAEMFDPPTEADPKPDAKAEPTTEPRPAVDSTAPALPK